MVDYPDTPAIDTFLKGLSGSALTQAIFGMLDKHGNPRDDLPDDVKRELLLIKETCM